MRTRFRSRNTPVFVLAIILFDLTLLAPARAQADDQKKDLPKAPSDHSIFESDMAGSYFIAKPLKEKYDNLLKRVGELRTEIDDARIEESKARREIDHLQTEIDAAIRQIDKEKLYVPGAIVQKRNVTKSVPLDARDYLFVEAENVEIRGGGEGPELKCIVEKTVLGETGKDQDLTSDFDGIELVVGRSSGKAKFGYYKTAAERPEIRHDYENFPFKPFLERDFTLISIKGLTHQEGNRQVNISVSSERGEGRSAFEWCRHAKVILIVPKCQGVGVRGGLRGFRVQSFDGPLMVEGEGNRDYETRYGVLDLGGPLTASNIPIHLIDGVKGDVSIVASAYNENTESAYASGVTMRTVAPKPSSYKNLQGGLLARFCRADLLLDGIAGRVDVTNEFGKTVWRADRAIAAMDHRIVSQSGTIEVHFASESLGKLRMMLFTECGAVRLPKGANGLQSLMFSGNTGDVTRRSWHGFFSGSRDERHSDFSVSLYNRIPAAVLGTRRAQGIDIISRAGTITYEPVAEKQPN